MLVQAAHTMSGTLARPWYAGLYTLCSIKTQTPNQKCLKADYQMNFCRSGTEVGIKAPKGKVQLSAAVDLTFASSRLQALFPGCMGSLLA